MGISIWWQHRCYLFIYSSLLLSFTFHSKFSLPFTFTLQRERDWGIHLHYVAILSHSVLFRSLAYKQTTQRFSINQIYSSFYMASSTFALYTTLHYIPRYHHTLL
jgi:hypothetical protein